MTRTEIEAWSEKAGQCLTAEALSAVPLSERQRARIADLRQQAAEYSRRTQQMQPESCAPREKRAAYGG